MKVSSKFFQRGIEGTYYRLYDTYNGKPVYKAATCQMFLYFMYEEVGFHLQFIKILKLILWVLL